MFYGMFSSSLGWGTMWGPPVISWFISPSNYSYKCHDHSEIGLICTDLAIEWGPHIVLKLSTFFMFFAPIAQAQSTGTAVYQSMSIWSGKRAVLELLSQWLVGGLEPELYFPFHIWDVILPIDFHIFQRGLKPPTRWCGVFSRIYLDDLFGKTDIG